MIQVIPTRKAEYGDFQTPRELAERICHKLQELGVSPNIIIEPTCGIGNFIKAATSSFQFANKIIGIEINQSHIQELRKNNQLAQDERIQLQQGDFFELDWTSLIDANAQEILVLGNFPWVTNSQQGLIESNNLPRKSNFQNHNGLDAITGKSNFDISEWMLIQSVQRLQKRTAYLAMLCKTSVARKILSYIAILIDS